MASIYEGGHRSMYIIIIYSHKFGTNSLTMIPISPLQFGFTENSSTLQQMLLFIDSIVNHPSQTDVIYLDISKAFDTVSHGILLSKLWHFGISGSLWAWFKNYLSNRYQRVSINNNLSHTLPVVSGVPCTG